MPELTLYESIISVYINASKDSIREGNYAVAERVARNGLAVNPDSTSLKELRGEALLRLGLEKEALRVFKHVNSISKTNRTFARIGLLLARQGHVRDSQNMASSGILETTMPKAMMDYVPNTRTRRGLEMYWLLAIAINSDGYGQDSQSIYYYTEAQQLLSNHVFANSRLGKIYMREERYVEAADCYRRITSGSEKEVTNAKQQLKIALFRAEKAKQAANAGGGG